MLKPPASPIRAYIFDLDGTLVDSKLDIVNSVNAMLRATGRREMPLDTVAGYVGHGAPRLIASVLGPEVTQTDKDSALSIFLEHYESHNLDATRAYPGVLEGLQALSEFPLAVLTNKPAKAAKQILEGLGLLHFFSAVYGGDSFPNKKPNPTGALFLLEELSVPAEHSAMVGDSDVDIQTARNAGMQAVAVSYGFGNFDSLTNPADLYIDSIADLVTLWPTNRS